MCRCIYNTYKTVVLDHFITTGTTPSVLNILYARDWTYQDNQYMIWVYSKNLGVSTTKAPHELITTISDYKEFGFLRNHLAFLVMGEAIWICGGEQQFFLMQCDILLVKLL